MANYRGQDGSLQYNANPIGELKSWSISSTLDVMEDTVMGDAWKTQVGGLAGWSGSAEAHLDYGDTLGQKVMIDKLLTATPGSTSMAAKFLVSATKYFSGNVLITDIQSVAQLGDIIKVTFTFKGTGALATTWS